MNQEKVSAVAVIKKDLRAWGVVLIVMGIIQIAVPFLNTPWGAILIALGIINLFIPRREMYIANGIAIIVAGIINVIAIVDKGGGPGAFAVLQFIWGANEIRKFFKYRPEPAEAPAVIPETNKPNLAGILSIIAGAIVILYMTTAIIVTTVRSGGVVDVIIMVGLIIIASIPILGGIQARKRQKWGLSLIGAICSLFCFLPLGIAALILLAQSRAEFKQEKIRKEAILKSEGDNIRKP